MGMPPSVGYLHEPAYDAGEITLVLLGHIQPDGHILPNDLVEINPAVLAAELRLNLKQPTDLVLHRDRANRQNIRTKGGLVGLAGWVDYRSLAWFGNHFVITTNAVGASAH